jgi:hypothetical protein
MVAFLFYFEQIHVSNPPAVPPGMEYKLSEFLKIHKERINFLDEAFDTTPFSVSSLVTLSFFILFFFLCLMNEGK